MSETLQNLALLGDQGLDTADSGLGREMNDGNTPLA
jgi:hypothetical protein